MVAITGSAAGLAWQDVGRVKNGVSGSWLVLGQGFSICFAKAPPATHSHPRSALWRGSPGTPHSVTWLLSTPATCVTFATVATTA